MRLAEMEMIDRGAMVCSICSLFAGGPARAR
jgi:hypothetical protein